ncbi:hypothetical protein V6B08_10265 [Ferrovibrio sp. MS7]|uniref:hypothetical protein n=1 Tax=Ferrovibrio plantarum TaxID=3119164 RepID=UPI0031355614
MATIDTSSSTTTLQQSLLQRSQPAAEQSSGSDNRTVGAQTGSAVNQGSVNAATEAAQRPTIVDQTRQQERGGDTRDNRVQQQQDNGGFDQAFRLDIRSPQGNQAAQGAANDRQQPAGGRAQEDQNQNGVPFSFSANGAVNTSSNPNQAGQRLSLSV